MVAREKSGETEADLHAKVDGGHSRVPRGTLPVHKQIILTGVLHFSFCWSQALLDWSEALHLKGHFLQKLLKFWVQGLLC